VRCQTLALTMALLLAAETATAADQEGGQCVPDLHFTPGPIVNGQHRQPTQSEIDQRMQQLIERHPACAFSNPSAACCGMDAAHGSAPSP